MSILFAMCPDCGATARFTGSGTRYQIEKPVQHHPSCKAVKK